MASHKQIYLVKYTLLTNIPLTHLIRFFCLFVTILVVVVVVHCKLIDRGSPRSILNIYICSWVYFSFVENCIVSYKFFLVYVYSLLLWIKIRLNWNLNLLCWLYLSSIVRNSHTLCKKDFRLPPQKDSIVLIVAFCSFHQLDGLLCCV